MHFTLPLPVEIFPVVWLIADWVGDKELSFCDLQNASMIKVSIPYSWLLPWKPQAT